MDADAKFKLFFDAFNEAVTQLYSKDGQPAITLGFGSWRPVKGRMLTVVPMPLPAAETRLLTLFSRACADSIPADFFGLAMDAWHAFYDEGADEEPGYKPPSERPDRQEGVAVFVYRRQAIPLASAAYWEVKRGPDGGRLPLERAQGGPHFTGGRALEWSSQVLTPDEPDKLRVSLARVFMPAVTALVELRCAKANSPSP